MISTRYPVVLVHGWNSHPGVWKRLDARLNKAEITAWRFDHNVMRSRALPDISRALGEYITRMRDESGWPGPVDIVCHSLGTCIARYLVEVLDGTTRSHAVRQLIGLGPPNNGSTLAELFNDPVRGEAVINRLTGVFVPRGFDPATEQIVQDVRPGSPVIRRLRTAGLRPDITYRIIVTTNPDDIPGFFPWFGGKTWEMVEDGRYRATLAGDGVVTYRESVLPGISLDILSVSRGQEECLPSPDQYCHINLPKNPVILDRIMDYLVGNPEGKD
jgi:triacylglycerol lipase